MDTQIMELENQALTIDEKAQGIVVKTQPQYDMANDFLKAIKGLQTKIKDTFRPIIDQAHKAHKEAVSQEKKHLEPLLAAEILIKNKMMAYINEQERIRQEVERKLQAEAEKKRQEALAKAEVARANGKEAKAEKYEEKASQIVAPTLAPSVDKGSAVIKKIWHAEVFDLMALVKAIAAGQVPLACVEASMPILNSQARALKDTMAYPGVKAVAEDNLSTRIK